MLAAWGWGHNGEVTGKLYQYIRSCLSELSKCMVAGWAASGTEGRPGMQAGQGSFLRIWLQDTKEMSLEAYTSQLRFQHILKQAWPVSAPCVSISALTRGATGPGASKLFQCPWEALGKHPQKMTSAVHKLGQWVPSWDLRKPGKEGLNWLSGKLFPEWPGWSHVHDFVFR